jgi:hypothetical protein
VNTLARDLRQLVRLRALREDAAQAMLAQCRQALARAEEAVARRRAQIEGLRRARHALVGWRSGAGACQMPRIGVYGQARMAALDDELERAEVELIDEEAALRRAAQALADAQAGWLNAHARHLGVQQRSAQQRRADGRAAEQRAEREREGGARRAAAGDP